MWLANKTLTKSPNHLFKNGLINLLQINRTRNFQGESWFLKKIWRNYHWYITVNLPHKVKMQYLQNIKHSRYIHLMSNFSSIHFHAKRLYVHMFDIVYTPFSYERGLMVCSSLQEFSKTKEESTLHVIWNAGTAFLWPLWALLLTKLNLTFASKTLIIAP